MQHLKHFHACASPLPAGWLMAVGTLEAVLTGLVVGGLRREGLVWEKKA